MKKSRGVVHERSAGAVVYRQPPGQPREFLLLRYGAGHWGFPKGHVEDGETDPQAARREVTEETSIPPEGQRFIEGFREDTIYTFQRGRTRVEKKVLFFLVEVQQREVKISHEHTDFTWLPYQKAREQLSFEGPRRALHNAEEFLRRREAAAERAAREGATAGARKEPGGST